MVPDLLMLALEFHRAPLRFERLTNPDIGLPNGFERWLTDAGGALAPGKIRETAAYFGTSPEQLREALLFFLRQTLLSPQSDYYRVLGLSRQCSADRIKRHHRLLVRLFHPDRTPGDDRRSAALTARINAAYQVLRNPQARRRYDDELPPLPNSGLTTAAKPRISQPHKRIMSSVGSRRPVRTGVAGAPSEWQWMVAFLAALGLLLGTLYEPTPPSLRVNPELAAGIAPGPYFVCGTDSAVVSGGQGVPKIADSPVPRMRLDCVSGNPPKMNAEAAKIAEILVPDLRANEHSAPDSRQPIPPKYIATGVEDLQQPPDAAAPGMDIAMSLGRPMNATAKQQIGVPTSTQRDRPPELQVGHQQAEAELPVPASLGPIPVPLSPPLTRRARSW